jgi:prepilin-type N-terminal cleavage/methylation domain-containing protein
MRQFSDRLRKARGTTLIELLAAMAILSVLMVVLGVTLEAAMGRFREGASATGNQVGVEAARSILDADLASVFSNRPAKLPRLLEVTTLAQREFFEDRLFLPFEINRKSGEGVAIPVSIQNAAPGFDSLVFPTLRGLPGESVPSSSPAIVAYYVAYARHSPLAGDGGAGMKLFRHFRRAGNHTGDAYAAGYLLHCSQKMNDAWDELKKGDARPLFGTNPATIRQGYFENADQPFLFSSRVANLKTLAPVSATHPWPVNPIRERLTEAPADFHPARGSAEEWGDPESGIHDSVFPDEPVCDHVVRFELAPYRRVVGEGGKAELMGAVEINRYLGLNGGEEWPVLVVPDFIEVTIVTVSDKAAKSLMDYNDWVIDWENENSATWSNNRRIIERERKTFQFRVSLPRRAT